MYIPGNSLCHKYVISVHACMCMCVWDTPHPISTPTHPPILSTPVDPWISKNSIWLELIKIIQFYLKIWNLWRLSHPYGCLVWWVDYWSGSCPITKHWIDIDLIEIIQFCLKICDLLRHPHLDAWVVCWMGHSFDILTFFDFLLKPPQPLTGLLLRF